MVDEEGELLQKTDRTGFIENEAFRDIQRFSIDALEWMHERRLAEREREKPKQKRKQEERSASAKQNFQREIDQLTPDKKEAIFKAARELEDARASEQDLLRDELTLYKDSR